VQGDGLVAVPEAAAPCAAALVAATAHFLGPYMIKDFDLIQFLEDASAASTRLDVNRSLPAIQLVDVGLTLKLRMLAPRPTWWVGETPVRAACVPCALRWL